MERILFKEEQRFTQWWLLLIVAASLSMPMLFLIRDIVAIDKQSEEYRSLLTSILVLIGMGALMTALFATMKLSTEITSAGIRVKFPPLKMRWRTIRKEEILQYEVRKYRPIKEFGGWGYRKNILRKKDAYNVKGNMGLELLLRNGKTLLIGTQRKQAIKLAMDKLFADEEPGSKHEKIMDEKNKFRFAGRAKKLLIIFALELALIIVIFGIIQLFNL